MREIVKVIIAAFAKLNVVDAIVQSLTRYTMAALAGFVAALCAIGTLGCAIAALWIGVLPRVGPVWAPLIAAGALLLLCLAAVGVAYDLAVGRRPKAPPPPPAVSADMLVNAAERIFRERQGTVILAAAIAGILAGYVGRSRPAPNSPRVRPRPARRT